MTIGVDIRMLGGRRSGVQEYAEQVLARLIRLAPEHQFKFFFSSLRAEPPKYDWLSAPNARLYRFRIPNNLLFSLGRLFSRPRLDRLVGGADVWFSPHFFLAPLSASCRRVTTFHDLSYERFPDFFTFRQRWWHAFMNPRMAARRSDRVIAVSESTRRDLAERYGVKPAKISVIHSGSSLIRPEPGRMRDFRRDHNLPDRYVFCLATLEPRKNILSLIRAFESVKRRQGFDDLVLIISGAPGWLHRRLLQAVRKSPFKNDIRLTGYIEDDRALYYANASVFVYPSFFEGFGLPVVEAMACSVPVITSHNSSLVEVAGSAAILINPANISEIAQAMYEILSDPELHKRLIERGTARAAEFSWDNCARRTLEILTSVSSTAR
ncbi:MAG TPA: glycosyltransferase family 1 protein [Candidatus Paceibacterota bacterium]|nr:glycosyltransferase family 1 protein [Candidatus Paceibacterota bacterium]